MADNARKVLEALDRDYGFSVYGMGEFTPDVETVDVDEAMEHIEGMDESMVVLFDEGVAVGTLWIVGEDGEFDVYDWSLPDSLELIVDKATKED